MKIHSSRFLKWTAGLVLCALLLSLGGWLLPRLNQPGPDTAAMGRLKKLRALQERDRARLETYAWVDRTKHWVRIPIERAMELEERDLRSVRPHPVEPLLKPSAP